MFLTYYALLPRQQNIRGHKPGNYRWGVFEISKRDFLVYSHTYGITAMEGRGFYYPSDTALGKDGVMYTLNRSIEGVAGSTRGVRVTVYDLDGVYSHTFGTFGGALEDGGMVWPTSMVIDRKGQVHISDEHLNRIIVFDADGEFIYKWGEAGSMEGKLDGPSGMAFDGDENLFVVDHRNNRVQKFTNDGAFIYSFGSEGSGEGQFNLPWGITIDRQGDLFVADWRNDRIQKFSSDGKFITTYGSTGDQDGEFSRPSGVAVDGEGYIYVADWGNERVQVLDADGDFVAKYRGEATNSNWADEFLDSNFEEKDARLRSDLEPELGLLAYDAHEESSHTEKYFWAPISVKLDKNGRLYVTESNRHRVQVYDRGLSTN